jgi:hypothetical protein
MIWNAIKNLSILRMQAGIGSNRGPEFEYVRHHGSPGLLN